MIKPKDMTLSMEQEFEIQKIAGVLQQMSQEQMQQMILQLSVQSMIQQNIVKVLVGNALCVSPVGDS